jgi:hypothetical protein
VLESKTMSTLQRQITAFLGGFALVATMGCAHFQTAPHPLYSGPVQPLEQTATLSGYVSKVDDIDVSHLPGPFTLLPGCHVVIARTNNVGDGSPSGAWRAVVPRTEFAFRMQAGHAYEVEVQRQGSGSETSNLKMRAAEMDARGKRLGDVPAVRSKDDVEACREWAAEQSK